MPESFHLLLPVVALGDVGIVYAAEEFVYLAAIIDWYSRRVLSGRLSNTMDTSFCVEALREAAARYGCPEILNTDQGSQFTREEFTGAVLERGIKLSMAGKGAGSTTFSSSSSALVRHRRRCTRRRRPLLRVLQPRTPARIVRQTDAREFLRRHVGRGGVRP